MPSFLRKALKLLGFLVLLIVIGFFILWLFLHEKEPVGETGPAADQLAEKMMAAVDKAAWDSTRWVQWTFASRHDYLWDKERNLVKISWDENVVLLNTKTISGKAFCAEEEVTGKKRDKLVWKGWEYFCNDSYWLNPVVKAFDPGTERSIVPLGDGEQGLKVQYASGGVTPGDTYIWILDENNRPKAWKMWVKIIPIGGFGNTWEGWQQLRTGAFISTNHTFFGKEVEMISDLDAATNRQDLGLTQDPFAQLMEVSNSRAE